MNDLSLEYIHQIKKGLQEIETKEIEAINNAGAAIGHTIAEGKLFHLFGSGHSDLIAHDCFLRAGGLACANKISDATWGQAERIENYGTSLIERYDLRPSEVLVIISNSGRNPAPIEIALYAKEHDLKVVAITSYNHSKAVNSRHSSGKKLYDIADIVIDNHAPLGDACIELRDELPKTGAVSTILGATILNMILVQAASVCVETTGEAPLIISQNLDNMDQHNRDLWLKYKQRLGAIEI